VSDDDSRSGRFEHLTEQHRWLTFVLPLLVYMIAGSFEPSPPDPSNKASWINIPYTWYPAIYTIKIAFTLVAMAVVWFGYRAVPLRGSVIAILVAIAVGAIGVLLWVGIWKLQLEKQILAQSGVQKLLSLVGCGDLSVGTRPSFDPFTQMHGMPALMTAFLAVRFVGLAVIVPVIEEFFLRGFAMRFVMSERWWEVPWGQMNATAVAVSFLLPALMHPAEVFAALAWFGMITLLYWRTRSIWNCVIAHAATNLLLGIYIVRTGSWSLW
jgi:hypothetical protein